VRYLHEQFVARYGPLAPKAAADAAADAAASGGGVFGSAAAASAASVRALLAAISHVGVVGVTEGARIGMSKVRVLALRGGGELVNLVGVDGEQGC
jgi:hypothetical protein